MSLVTCNNCGWVHMGRTREQIDAEVQHGSQYDYRRCFSCGESYTEFHPTVEGECPDGCTIQPILMKE